ncbi:MAG: hypothetical protein ABI782_01695 [Anaerolineaceae bacterium]
MKENAPTVVVPTTTTPATQTSPITTATTITSTSVPTPAPRTISTLVDNAEAGKSSVVVGGASDYEVNTKFTLNYGKATQEELVVVSLQFEHRTNRGVYVLFLRSTLTYSHTSGEDVSEIPRGAPPRYQIPNVAAPASRIPSVPQIPTNVTFQFDASTTQSDQDVLRLGVERASQLYDQIWSRPADGLTIFTTTQTCSNEVVVAGWVAPKTVCVNIVTPLWTNRTFEQKFKGAAHEYLHNIQETIGCNTGWVNPGHDTIWIGEGAAEFYAYWTLSESGYGPLYKSLEELKKTLRGYNALTLAQMESAPIATKPETFNVSLAAVAVDYLVSKSDLHAYITYCELRSSGMQWKTAFEKAFGLTIPEFYEQFELYRASGYR